MQNYFLYYYDMGHRCCSTINCTDCPHHNKCSVPDAHRTLVTPSEYEQLLEFLRRHPNLELENPRNNACLVLNSCIIQHRCPLTYGFKCNDYSPKKNASYETRCDECIHFNIIQTPFGRAGLCQKDKKRLEDWYGETYKYH